MTNCSLLVIVPAFNNIIVSVYRSRKVHNEKLDSQQCSLCYVYLSGVCFDEYIKNRTSLRGKLLAQIKPQCPALHIMHE